MMTMSMNTKRERRPNVRLEEIGDLPAAVSFVNKVRGGLQRNGSNTSANLVGYKFDDRAIEGVALVDSGKVENSSSSAEVWRDIENKNPNSFKPGFGLLNSEDFGLGKVKVEFGNVTKKRSVMKRKKRTSNSGDCSFGSALNNSRLGSNESGEDTKKKAKESYLFNSFGSSDFYHVIGSTSYSGPEISTTSKEDFDDYIVEPPFPYRTGTDQMSNDETVLYDIDKWLEGNGFGKYVKIFEMHEVDEEALPLLTSEDLKEMGVNAVGQRRKLYSAIQQLRRNGNHE